MAKSTRSGWCTLFKKKVRELNGGEAPLSFTDRRAHDYRIKYIGHRAESAIRDAVAFMKAEYGVDIEVYPVAATRLDSNVKSCNVLVCIPFKD